MTCSYNCDYCKQYSSGPEPEEIKADEFDTEFPTYLSYLDEDEPLEVQICGVIILKHIEFKGKKNWYVLIQQKSKSRGGFKTLPGGKKIYASSEDSGLEYLYEDSNLEKNGLTYIAKIITQTKTGKIICNSIFIADNTIPITWLNNLPDDDIGKFEPQWGNEIHACEGHAWVKLKFLVLKNNRNYTGNYSVFQKFEKILEYI